MTDTWYSKNRERVLLQKKRAREASKCQKQNFLIELYDSESDSYKATSFIVNSYNKTVSSVLNGTQTVCGRLVQTNFCSNKE